MVNFPKKYTTQNISFETYKKLLKLSNCTEPLPGDEKFTAIVFFYGDEYIYIPPNSLKYEENKN